MRTGLNFTAAIVAAVLVALGSSIFTVDQRQYAIVFQLGEVREVISAPGLYFKWPLIQNVRYFDKRILTLDAAEPRHRVRPMKLLCEYPSVLITYWNWEGFGVQNG